MYHVGRNGQQTGPFSIEQLKAMVERGELQPTDLVWKEGMSAWEPASTVPGIFSSGPMPMVTSQPIAPLAQSTVLPPLAGPGGAKQNGLALTSMILGIVSLTVGMCCCYGAPFSIAGIVCAIIALNQLKTNPTQSGKGMAVAGLWCSIASIVIGILLMIFGVAMNAFNWEEFSKELNKAQTEAEKN